MNAPTDEVIERELPQQIDTGVLAVISKAEIDVQIATAHRFPRSVRAFRDEAFSMVTLTEAVAEECIYALPRDGKTIEGPSARFAEVIASAWGNSRAGARVVDDSGEFVTAQGVFHDLQKNVAITYEVKRRITDKKGRRYNADMIGVTANAACSIALRNAILKGVPKAFWADVYEAARKTIMGDFQTLANRRASALAAFQKFGVKAEQIYANLGVAGEEDITLEHVVTMRGMLTALKEGDSTPEQMFPTAQPEVTERSAQSALKAAATGGKKDEKKTEGAPPPTVTAIDAIAKLAAISDVDLIAMYAETLPQSVRGDERFTKAVKARIDELKTPAKK
jgi:hypothetical protein